MTVGLWANYTPPPVNLSIGFSHFRHIYKIQSHQPCIFHKITGFEGLKAKNAAPGPLLGRQPGAAGAVFFSVSRRGAGGFTGTGGKLPIQFDSFLFGWMKIFHPSCQSLAFSAPSAYYYNKNPSRFLCRFAHRVQKGTHCHDHHGAKSRTA